MTSVVKYSKADFDKIQMEGFTYQLSQETMKIIQTIANQVGAPEYIKTPQFEKRISTGASGAGTIINRHKKGKAQELNDNDWNALRNFPTTTLYKKEGIDASIDQIRKHLNKMTNKTYDSAKAHIIEEIEKINVSNCDGINSDGNNSIGESIFNIASGNSFFSSMYADLFKELMEKFDFMRVIFDANFDKFRSIFNTIEYCDPNTDYDKFCINNKENEKRRAISLFYVNLMIKKVVPSSKILDIIIDLQIYMNKIIFEENNKNIVDELSEVLYILIINSYDTLMDESRWNDIIDFIKVVSQMKQNLVPSVTNKTIFKHMDMLDVL
jgi:hypothetical protein